MGINIIRRAVLTSNVVTMEIPEGEPLQAGALVTVTGCTTVAFNATYTVTTAGLCVVTNGGNLENWSGFTAPLTHANIAIESEPTSAPFATASTGFGTSTSSQSQVYDT